jgi:hypothetical protein
MTSPDVITRKEMDESLDRVLKHVLFEVGQHCEHANIQFGVLRGDIADVRAGVDRQGGLIQSGVSAFLRIGRIADLPENLITELSDQVRSLEIRLARLEPTH